MINFKFEDKTISLPNSWDEVTVAMFTHESFVNADPLRLLSELSGIPVDKLANTKEDLLPYFQEVSNFIREDPIGWKRGELKEEIEIRGVKCKIPKNIELERFGQKVMLGQYILKFKDTPLKTLPYALALYVAPQVIPEDWSTQVDELADEVAQLPITTVYPIADFFLNSLKPSPRNGSVYSKTYRAIRRMILFGNRPEPRSSPSTENLTK